MPQPDQEQLLRLAHDNAGTLLKRLQQDQSTLAPQSDGQSAHIKAIDAARTTLDNLALALEGTPLSTDPD